MGRGTGRRGSFCDPFAAEAVKASRRPNRRLIQGGEGWLRGRTALWRNRQYNACCQKPLSRDFENHRPASEGAWLVSIVLSGSCHKATQRSRQAKGLCAAGRPPLYLLMPAGRSGALGPKVSCGHTLSFGSRDTDGETSREPRLRKASTRMPLNWDFPRRTAILLTFSKFFICEVPLENTKQIPSYPKIQGYA